MSLVSFLTENKKTVFGAGLLSALPLLFSSLVIALLLKHQDFFLNLDLMGWLPFFALSVLTMSLALTPSTFVALVSGFFMGWTSVPFMLVAYLTASALGYWVGSVLDGGHLIASIKGSPKVSQVISGLKARGWTLMFLVRLSPVLPFALMNLLMPALKVRFPVFLAGGFVGMLPRTLFSIWLGIQAQDILVLLKGGEGGEQARLLVLILTVVSVGGLLALGSRAYRLSQD